jgi:hypothetical protein
MDALRTPLKLTRRAVMIACLLLTLNASVNAQALLAVKRVVTNWPTIETYFTVHCNGMQAYFSSKSFFTLYVDQKQTTDFDLWCPDPMSRCAMSAAMVFGQGVDNAGVREAGKGFVALMDNTSDEATVIWCGNSVMVSQSMTASRVLLRGAIDQLPSASGLPVREGMYTGLMEVISQGVNQCRAVVALIGGVDPASAHSIDDIVALATRNHIRVFTVVTGPGVDTTEAGAIATRTGGQCYVTQDAASVSLAYQDIAIIIGQGFRECMIAYHASCSDGRRHDMTLTEVTYCGGSGPEPFSYIAPLDSATFTPLQLRIGEGEALGGREVLVPLELLTDIDGEDFQPSTLTIGYDTARLRLKEVRTATGDIWDGVSVRVSPGFNGANIQTLTRSVVASGAYPRRLGTLVFETREIAADSIRVPVSMRYWTFSNGCHTAVTAPGSVLLRKSTVFLTCTSDPAIAFLLWNRNILDYNDNPFTVTMRVYNTGTETAVNGRFVISFPQGAFELVSPKVPTISGVPADIAPGAYSQATWQLRALRRRYNDTVRVTIKGFWDNTGSIDCFSNVWVSAADPQFQCNLVADSVTVDTVNSRYDPMPFTLNLSVLNIGERSDSVTAMVYFPDDLRLDGPLGPRTDSRFIEPARLNPSQRGTASWKLWHPPALKDKHYTVSVFIQTSEVNWQDCSVDVTIPAMPGIGLLAMCEVPDSLQYVDSLERYLPDPFVVRVYCRNKGKDTINNVSATILLPPAVMLAQGERADQAFFPSSLGEYQGGPLPWVGWSLRIETPPVKDTTLVFRFHVTGNLRSGEPFDTTVACTMRLPGVKVTYDCDLRAPDTLRANASGTDVMPNPIELRYRVWNTSPFSGTIRMTSLTFSSGNGLSLDPATPQVQTLNELLHPGDTATVTWLIHVDKRLVWRRGYFTVVSYDSFGNPIVGHPTCDQWIDIAPVSSLDAPKPAALPGAFELGQNIPNPFSNKTLIPFNLPQQSTVKLVIFNALGNQVTTLYSGARAAGSHQMEWNGTDDAGRRVPAGIYFCRLQARTGSGLGITKTRTMIVRK